MKRKNKDGNSGILLENGRFEKSVFILQFPLRPLRLCALCALCVCSLFALPPERRYILALYNGDIEKTYSTTLIHQHAEYVLNYMGYIVEPCDITKDLPSPAELGEYAAVFSWFRSSSMPDPIRYLNWLEALLAKGIKIIMWSDPGLFENSKTQKQINLSRINRFFARVGLEYYGEYTDNPLLVRINHMDTSLMEFERSIDRGRLKFDGYKNISSKNKSHFSLKMRNKEKKESDICVTGPQGGFVFGDYVMYEHIHPGLRDTLYLKKFHLNPFLFFELVFQNQDKPKLDVSVNRGRRVFYSHIDGDGFSSLSHIGKNLTCIDVIKREILEHYQLPISTSFITSGIHPMYRGNQEKADLVLSIASLPNTEIASHTFSHPFVWSKAQESLYQTAYEEYHLRVPGYPERVIETEIQGSIQYLDSLAKQAGKSCSMIFWSGNCSPEKDALYVVHKNNYLNINGGEPRFDRAFNSYVYVTPLTKRVGRYRQVYTSNSNETIYTNGWTGPYSGFSKVIETFENTGHDMIYRPMNVYYHYYSGERMAGLNALKKVYDYCLSQPVNPVFTSQYIKMVQGFFSGSITKMGTDRWEIKNNGACKTIRFDSNNRVVHMEKSENVIGWSYIKDRLYVYLGEKSNSVISLTSRSYQNKIPFLVNTNTNISNWQQNNGALSFTCIPWFKPELVIAGLEPNVKYKINIKQNTNTQTQTTKADKNGKTTLSILNHHLGKPHGISISPM
ncbi:MAG: DUF2194 domain-containing protein [Fibrobacteria bacterium]|nr:DUF2194 domain-containing protein [Fibrobacteria bacterium]